MELLLAAGIPCGPPSSVEGVRARFDDRVEAVALDFTDASTWQSAYTGVDRIFLMRPPHLRKPKKQMLPSLEAAKAAGRGCRWGGAA